MLLSCTHQSESHIFLENVKNFCCQPSLNMSDVRFKYSLLIWSAFHLLAESFVFAEGNCLPHLRGVRRLPRWRVTVNQRSYSRKCWHYLRRVRRFLPALPSSRGVHRSRSDPQKQPRSKQMPGRKSASRRLTSPAPPVPPPRLVLCPCVTGLASSELLITPASPSDSSADQLQHARVALTRRQGRKIHMHIFNLSPSPQSH